MRSSTRYPTDSFNLFLILVLLIWGTRFRGASAAGFTNQPAEAPAPPTPEAEPDVQGHNNDAQDDALEHSEIPQIPTDDLKANQDQQESTSSDTDTDTDTYADADADTGTGTDTDAVTEKGATPAPLTTTETTTENPPMTLPADKLIKKWRHWPEGKK